MTSTYETLTYHADGNHWQALAVIPEVDQSAENDAGDAEGGADDVGVVLALVQSLPVLLELALDHGCIHLSKSD